MYRGEEDALSVTLGVQPRFAGRRRHGHELGAHTMHLDLSRHAGLVALPLDVADRSLRSVAVVHIEVDYRDPADKVPVDALRVGRADSDVVQEAEALRTLRVVLEVLGVARPAWTEVVARGPDSAEGIPNLLVANQLHCLQDAAACPQRGVPGLASDLRVPAVQRQPLEGPQGARLPRALQQAVHVPGFVHAQHVHQGCRRRL
mmetsp:Transcript_130355/g.363183  ORF Transcript_130355/g.363183 Transcript_130355/m.363183 type:complete len:203 (-) Transcript_130355:43-651(-)